MDNAVQNSIKFAGISLSDAVDHGDHQPRPASRRFPADGTGSHPEIALISWCSDSIPTAPPSS
jgi:hypothetical protein